MDKFFKLSALNKSIQAGNNSFLISFRQIVDFFELMQQLLILLEKQGIKPFLFLPWQPPAYMI